MAGPIYNEEVQISTAGNSAGCEAIKEPKFQVLLNAANGADDVINHLAELHRLLGVTHESSPKNDIQKSPNEPSLVRTLNELPQNLRDNHSLMHEMIQQIINELN